jgi:carbonic anhydrase
MSANSENINISQQNVQGKCDLKCSYLFQYHESNSSAKNNGIMISVSYENNQTSPVVYNNQKYNVSTLSIVSPSIHVFNDVVAAAEIWIEHTPVMGGPLLNVAIPMISSSETSEASEVITDIIKNVSTYAPVDGETTQLNISGFTLNTLIPKKPFFSYTDADTDNTQWIVFGITEAIPLKSDVLSTLSQIIQPYSLSTTGNGLFFNSKGPSDGTNMGDGIYISCQPTGSSKEEMAVSYQKNTYNNNLHSLLNHPGVLLLFQIIMGCLLFLLLFFILNYSYTYFTTNKANIPRIPGISRV